MIKPVVFALSMMLGGAAVALTVSVQRDPTTLTSLPPPLLERTTESLVRVQSARWNRRFPRNPLGVSLIPPTRWCVPGQPVVAATFKSHSQ